MNFLYFEVTLADTSAVRVDLTGTEANVKVMDRLNFQQYKSGRPHRFFGGHYKRSPALIRPETGGQWFVTVDTAGYHGEVKAVVSVV